MIRATLRHSILVVLSLLLSRPAHAADWSWIAQAVGKPSSTVFADGRWGRWLRQQLPSAKLDLGVAKRPVLLADSVAELLGGPPDDAVLANGLVRLSGCRRHSCPEKAMVLIDLPGQRATFALVHFKLGDDQGAEPMLLVVSGAPAPAPEHLAAIDAWLAEKGVKPAIRRYRRPSGELVNLDAPSSADLEHTFGFDWLKPTKVRCAPLKALAVDPATCWLGSGSSFLPVDGTWYRCARAKAEILLYPSQAICQEQLETMKANGD